MFVNMYVSVYIYIYIYLDCNSTHICTKKIQYGSFGSVRMCTEQIVPFFSENSDYTCHFGGLLCGATYLSILTPQL